MPETKQSKNSGKSSSKEMTGSQVLLKSFQDLGIDFMVGYTGGAIMPTFDTFNRFPKLKFITTRHEQGAGFIAGGYSRASGKLAPILVTSGPGATNLITSAADAMMDSIPMFMVTGQVATSVIGTDAFQETDVSGLMYPITKHTLMPLSADELSLSVGQLHHIATTARTGPVCLDIPKNVQTETTTNVEIPKDLDLPGYKTEFKINKDDIKKAAKLINEAKRPVALVGHGVIMSSSKDEILDFLNKGKIPASTTLHGLSSIPSSHELNLGMMGMHGEIEANRAIEKADLLIALGMRFDDRVTGKLDRYALNSKVIHVEIDPSEIGKNVKADASINGDLKEVLTLLTKEIDKKKEGDRDGYLAEIRENKQKSKEFYKHIFEIGVGREEKLLTSRIIHELSDFTKGKDNIISDVGQHQMFTAKFYKFERFNSWFSSGGLGTMGFGLPTAIGVKIARPKEEVWAVVGDGGFQMNIQELGTILQEKLNINILVMNNSYLGMVKQWQNLFFEDNYAETKMINPDFSKIADAYGLAHRKVEKVEDIKSALEWSKKETKPTIVEFITDWTENVYPMIPSGWSFDKMIENEDHGNQVLKGK